MKKASHPNIGSSASKTTYTVTEKIKVTHDQKTPHPAKSLGQI